MTCEGFLHQPGGCAPVKLLGFICLKKSGPYKTFLAKCDQSDQLVYKKPVSRWFALF